MADFLVIGAGIGGLATAQALLRLGHQVRVYEAAAELREIGAGVVLGANATRALDELGLHAAVRPVGTPLTTVRLLSEHGRILNRANTLPFTERLGYDNLGVLRADLQHALLRALPPSVMHLGRRLARFEQTDTHVTAFFENGEQATAEALIAADGIRSRVRRQLLPTSQPRYAGYTCWRAVVQADIADLPTTGSSETWGRAGRFGLVPVANNRVYWFACLNSSVPNNPTFQAYRVADLQRHFAGFHAPIPQVLAATTDANLLWGDLFDLVPLASLAFGRVLLLGDAGHATTPNLGQGAGMAVEDAAVLARCISNAAADLPTAFKAFDQQRRPRTRRIVQQSRQLGQLAQFTPAWLAPLRNAVLAAVPDWLTARQIAWLYQEL
ncbi:monooxygenase [Hymenobacter setariae]|uniref:Monooxygenase n=1 Tax=Hymenobacter setariae TaxID=2594794 RepID=A0A558BSA2_9BACT|nr:FAD-dependent monooxygenase [Hymenobacter setariae]TVT39382.1 monooxygenase [Hymenobacter setariae]